MSAALTVRERARRELTGEILGAARRQLGEVGAPALSVRAVARELGLASSAVYRYFATRDELLTALIVEAYDSAGAAVEAGAARAPGRTRRARFTAGCRGLRGWARAHPHEYALVYGSPVPGYQGDERTTTAGARAPVALFSVLEGLTEVGGRASRATAAEAPELRTQARVLLDVTGLTVTPALVVEAGRCWTTLLGLVSSELFGQLRNTFDPADAFFEAAVAAMADDLGL